MTPEEINNEIAEKVMGWQFYLEVRGEYTHVVIRKNGREPWEGRCDSEKHKHRYKKICAHEIDSHNHCVNERLCFASDIAEAWQVVDKMRENGYDFEPVWLNGRPFMASFSKFDVVNVEWLTSKCKDKSAPMAICLAALEEMNVTLD